MNSYPVTDGQTDRQTEGDAYEPTVQYGQVGSKMNTMLFSFLSSPLSVYGSMVNH